jgi:hypothetical protein
MGLAGRATGTQAAKLGQEGPLGTEATARGSIDTLRVSEPGDTQSRLVKAASGGGATASPRSSGAHLRELKTQEGPGMRADLTRPLDITDHGLEQDPEVDVTFAGAGQPAGGGTNDARVSVTDEVMRLERGTTPGARTLDTAAR